MSTDSDRARRPRLAAAAIAAAIGFTALAIANIGPPESAEGPSVLSASKKPQPPIIDAGCDVDGVRVDYSASFSTSGTPEYEVVTAEVSDLATTCAGATISVRMLEGTTTLATAVHEDASTPIVTLEFDDPASAKRVNGVVVEIEGGLVPMPLECSSMTFDRFVVLTAGKDAHGGSKDRDLTYGGPGDDALRGDNQQDCLDGQGGADQLFGDNHDDVLLGGEGDDILTGGSGDDILHGGPGNDLCLGGSGKNTLIDCEPAP